MTSTTPSGASADDLVEPAVALVAEWLGAASRGETKAERKIARRLDRITGDPDAMQFTMQFVDRVARHRNHRLAARELQSLVRSNSAPSFLSPVDKALLRVAGVIAPRIPAIVMPIAKRRLRGLVGPMVIDAESPALHSYIRSRRRDGFEVNVNRLGEAVLGDREATHRFDDVLALVADPNVDYASVKLSSIVDHIDMWSLDVTFERITDRLRTLFTAAERTSTFVNLDMEEYRDLELTLRAFTEVLAEPAFKHVPAGIVVQAYLPDSWDAVQRLAAWSSDRHRRAGADIKVRLVKGANLAMERVDAALHGWEQAPYETKAEVDANYKRCLDFLFTAERTEGLRVGVASHNLFDVALAWLLATSRGVQHRVEFEMLQGIAAPQARVVREAGNGLRLYSPVVGRRDFDVAISYLFRRLEENTAEENYLRHAFSIEPGSPTFASEADRFRRAVGERNAVSGTPRRTSTAVTGADFDNEPDTDPSLAATQRWITEQRAAIATPARAPVTAAIDEIDEVFERARAAQPAWWAMGASGRHDVLRRVADELHRRRGELLVTMANEASKTFAEGDPEVGEAIDFARWYGQCGLELEHLDHVDFTPLGVIAVVPPWNFPVAIPAGGVCAALAAGNAVVFKPSPETPRCAEIVAEACWAAGVPAAVLQFVRTPDDDVGRRLVVSADAVIFTGSWETAELFRQWKPELRLFAETSGKNALVVTEQADLDLAAGDLIRSAFGHSGQKCSAASLGILVGGMYDDERFRAKLLDATTSLPIGNPATPGPALGPLTTDPSDRLLRALTTLDDGERWVLAPRQLDDSGRLWSPGIKEGVAAGSWFHRTECFGPVLGLMRADDLDHALALQNAVDFGLTGGIHTLDPAEADRWLERVEVGNAYINRHITGAIVRRQPFGGWKRSCVGGGAKAGGFDYLLQLGSWASDDVNGDPLAVSSASDDHWWRTHYGVDHDPSALFCESNVLRYRPRPGVIIRVGGDATDVAAARAIAAAERVGVTPLVSRAATESDADFITRAPWTRWGRVRFVGTVPPDVRRACQDAEVDVIDAAVTPNGRLELRHYLREQAISRTLHRFGNLVRS